MDINFKQSTTLGTNINVSTVAGSSSSEAVPSTAPTPPPYTVADLQESLGSSNTGIIGGTTPAADAEVLRNILATIKKDERRRLCYRSLLCLPLLPLTSCMIPTVFCIYSAWRMSEVNKVAKGGIRYMIRLEGDQWSRYVEHINADSPRRMKRAVPQRLLARGYGHILFGPQGFCLDALLAMEYKNIMDVRTEVIRAPNGIDMMLRAWFCRRLVVVRTNSNVNVNNDPFKFDIFLPPNMSTELLSSISNFITLESACRPVF